MIKSDAINQLIKLRDTMQERLDAEVAHIRNMPAREFAERGGYSIKTAEQIKSRFLARPGGKAKVYEPQHPLYHYSLATRLVTVQEVNGILKKFSYPFKPFQFFTVKVWRHYTVPEINKLISKIENCEYGGIGEIKESGLIFPAGKELYTVMTDLRSSWVIEKSPTRIVIKNDGGETREYHNTMRKMEFRKSTIPFLLALNHLDALGYIYSGKGVAIKFEGKR